MNKKFIILGSTGSIGKKTIDIIRKSKQRIELSLISTNKDIETVIKQSKEFNVKNIIISDKKMYQIAKIKHEKLKINFFNSFDILKKKFKKKEIYYSMLSITGIDGLLPALDLIKISKNLAIVNKESLICGWSLIKKKLRFFNTNFIPIDSEHFSINEIIKNKNKDLIKFIYITASGGPFLKFPNMNKKKISMKDALKHPNWSMGKKISIDSSTMMNKVFEVIEAKNIFDIPYKKIKIVTHPKSYVHSMVVFNNGLINLIAHKPEMSIPISNSIFKDQTFVKMNDIDLKILNNLEFKEINLEQFPIIKILSKMPNYNSLYETAIVTINDFFVELFLKKKINYDQLIKYIILFCNNKEILKFKKKYVKNVKQIVNLRKYLIFKLNNFVYNLHSND